MTTPVDDHAPRHPDRLVRALVIAPGSLDAVPVELDRNLTVHQAATDAARRLGVRPSNAGFQNDQMVELDGNLTLAQAGVNDDYVLYLIDTAGGQ